eukprot:403362393
MIFFNFKQLFRIFRFSIRTINSIEHNSQGDIMRSLDYFLNFERNSIQSSQNDQEMNQVQDDEETDLVEGIQNDNQFQSLDAEEQLLQILSIEGDNLENSQNMQIQNSESDNNNQLIQAVSEFMDLREQIEESKNNQEQLYIIGNIENAVQNLENQLEQENQASQLAQEPRNEDDQLLLESLNQSPTHLNSNEIPEQESFLHPFGTIAQNRQRQSTRTTNRDVFDDFLTE